jgi:hypothetical protein
MTNPETCIAHVAMRLPPGAPLESLARVASKFGGAYAGENTEATCGYFAVDLARHPQSVDGLEAALTEAGAIVINDGFDDCLEDPDGYVFEAWEACCSGGAGRDALNIPWSLACEIAGVEWAFILRCGDPEEHLSETDWNRLRPIIAHVCGLISRAIGNFEPNEVDPDAVMEQVRAACAKDYPFWAAMEPARRVNALAEQIRALSPDERASLMVAIGAPK